MSIFESILEQSHESKVIQQTNYHRIREENRLPAYGEENIVRPRRKWSDHHELIKQMTLDNKQTHEIRDALLKSGFKCSSKDVCAYIRNNKLKEQQ